MQGKAECRWDQGKAAGFCRYPMDRGEGIG
jgi:hypothetical protein